MRLGPGNNSAFKPVLTVPSGVSFGFKYEDLQATNSEKSTQEAFTWVGMSDCYTAYIVLEKALKFYTAYGEMQVRHATELLEKAFNQILRQKSVYSGLDAKKPRTMALIQMHNLRRNGKMFYHLDGAPDSSQEASVNEIQGML